MAAAKAAPRAAVIRSPPGASPPRAPRPASTSAPPSSSCAPAKARQAHDPFHLERPVRRRLSAQEGGILSLVRPQGRDQDLVAPFHHPAAVRGRHLRRLQRPQAHSGARDRGHGRSQAGRVLAHPHLPRPYRRRRQEGEEGLMGKQSRARVLGDHQAMAVARNIRVSPRKLNLVAQQIRGKKVDRALSELTFSEKRIAGVVKKTLQSAIANAENNHDLDVDDLVVKEASVGKNLVMKRFHARARGNAGGIEKFFSQITIVVEEKREEKKEEAKAPTSKAKPAAKKTSGKAPAKKPAAQKAKAKAKKEAA